MHTSRKNLFLYLPILILFLASFIWVLKAPDHFSWSADLYLRNDDTSVLSQLFYSDNDELSQDNSTDGTRDGNIVTFSGLPDLRSLTLFRFDPTNTQESYRVTHVGFFLNGEAFFTMDAADLEAQASPVNASWQLTGKSSFSHRKIPTAAFCFLPTVSGRLPKMRLQSSTFYMCASAFSLPCPSRCCSVCFYFSAMVSLLI